MVRVGSMQSNDLLLEYSKTKRGFQLINTVRVLEDQLVKKGIEESLQQFGIDIQYLKVYFCGANEWVIRARVCALSEVLKEGGE